MKKIVKPVVFICICFIFLSCATSPYTVVQAVDKELLSQNTVILEVGMVPRSLLLFPLLDAGIYNAGVKNSETTLAQIERTKLRSMNEDIGRAYQGMYNENVMTTGFSFGNDEPVLDYFSNADQETVERLVQLCEENEAGVIVTIMGQIVCTKVSAFGIKGVNEMNLNVCIFDKRGHIVAQGKVNTPGRSASATDIGSYGLLFDEGTAYCISLLQELTSPK